MPQYADFELRKTAIYCGLQWMWLPLRRGLLNPFNYGSIIYLLIDYTIFRVENQHYGKEIFKERGI